MEYPVPCYFRGFTVNNKAHLVDSVTLKSHRYRHYSDKDLHCLLPCVSLNRQSPVGKG